MVPRWFWQRPRMARSMCGTVACFTQLQSPVCDPTLRHPGDFSADISLYRRPTDLATVTYAHESRILSLANLDGLLAAVATRPGPRVISVADLIGKQAPQLPQLLARALAKVRTALHSWPPKGTRGGQDWIAALNRDYDPQQPAIPIPQPAQ